MATQTFDDVAKGLATTTSRRQALKILGIGLVGALAGALGQQHVTEASKCVGPLGNCNPFQSQYCCQGLTCFKVNKGTYQCFPPKKP